MVTDPDATAPVGSPGVPPAARERYFLTYRGTRLPLQLSGELPVEALGHRNTYFRAQYDAEDRMLRCEKRVYGEVELSHQYEYDAAGRLHCAVITVADDAPRTLHLAPRQAVP